VIVASGMVHRWRQCGRICAITAPAIMAARFSCHGHEDKACYTPVLCALTDKTLNRRFTPADMTRCRRAPNITEMRRQPQRGQRRRRPAAQREIPARVAQGFEIQLARKPQLRRRFMPRDRRPDSAYLHFENSISDLLFRLGREERYLQS